MTCNEAEAFIRCWWRSKTLIELCEAMHCDRRWASNRAAQMRRMGVRLKSMPRCIPPTYVPMLTEAEKQWLKKVADQEQAAAEAEAVRSRCSEFRRAM